MKTKIPTTKMRLIAIILTVVLYLSLVLVPNLVILLVGREQQTATLIGEIQSSVYDSSGRVVWYVKPFNHELGDILIPFVKTKETIIGGNSELPDYIEGLKTVEIVYDVDAPNSTTQFYGYETVSIRNFEGDVDSVVNDISFIIRNEKSFKNRFFLEKFKLKVSNVVKLEDREYGYLVYGTPYNEHFEWFTFERELAHNTICFYVDKETEIDEISRLLIEEGRSRFEINIRAPKINAYEQISVPATLSIEFDNWANCNPYTCEEFDNYSVLRFYKFGGTGGFNLNKTNTDSAPVYYYYDLTSGKISLDYRIYDADCEIDKGDLFLLNVKNGNRLLGRSTNEVYGNDIYVSFLGQGVTGEIVISSIPVEETDYSVDLP